MSKAEDFMFHANLPEKGSLQKLMLRGFNDYYNFLKKAYLFGNYSERTLYFRTKRIEEEYTEDLLHIFKYEIPDFLEGFEKVERVDLLNAYKAGVGVAETYFNKFETFENVTEFFENAIEQLWVEADRIFMRNDSIKEWDENHFILLNKKLNEIVTGIKENEDFFPLFEYCDEFSFGETQYILLDIASKKITSATPDDIKLTKQNYLELKAKMDNTIKKEGMENLDIRSKFYALNEAMRSPNELAYKLFRIHFTLSEIEHSNWSPVRETEFHPNIIFREDFTHQEIENLIKFSKSITKCETEFKEREKIWGSDSKSLLTYTEGPEIDKEKYTKILNSNKFSNLEKAEMVREVIGMNSPLEHIRGLEAAFDLKIEIPYECCERLKRLNENYHLSDYPYFFPSKGHHFFDLIDTIKEYRNEEKILMSQKKEKKVTDIIGDIKKIVQEESTSKATSTPNHKSGDQKM